MYEMRRRKAQTNRTPSTQQHAAPAARPEFASAEADHAVMNQRTKARREDKRHHCAVSSPSAFEHKPSVAMAAAAVLKPQ